jgi:choline-sulfatase
VSTFRRTVTVRLKPDITGDTRWKGWTAIWLSALCLFACAKSAASPPNILLITLDTTRADRIGAYGYSRAATPRLDRLAREGVLFERALAAAPITLPAHASLMTGSYPFVHGVRDNGAFSLSDTAPTLAATLHGQGYRTAAFVGAFVLDRRFGLARGFDTYDDRLVIERRGDRTAAAARAWLGARRGDGVPFFLWLHLYDPHDPYDPPPPFRDRFADRPYDGEIAFADAAIGTVLDTLEEAGRRSSTIVAVAGDHGESLGEHGEDTHAVFVYESTMRVPMIVAWPGRVVAGTRVRAMVRAIDLAPTLLDLAGQPALAGAQGRTLVPLLEHRAPAPDSAYGESYFPLVYMNWAPLRSLRDDRWKFIDAPAPELYDLSRDPGEAINLARREPSRVDAMRRALDALTGGQAGAMAHRRVDSETAARLAALGYVGSAAGGSTPQGGARRDPKEMIAVFNRIRQANAALQAGRFAEANAIAREALAQDRRNAFATIVVADAALAQGRYRDALDAYRAYLDLVPTSADAHHRTAIAWARLGDLTRALAEEDAALAIDRRHADALVHRGGLLASQGRTDEAMRALRSAVEIAPDNAPYRVGLARILVAAGELDGAEAEVRRALDLQPDNPDAHAAFGAVWLGRDQPAKAVAEFQQALALRPDADDIRLDFAAALGRAGRAADARAEYARLASGSNTPPAIRQAARERLR